MTRKKWSKVKPGELVELNGRTWELVKRKPKGKRLRVWVSSGSHRADSLVDPDAKVKIGEAPKPAKAKTRKPPPVKPPKPATGDVWDTQQDRIERSLAEIGARLIGESVDGGSSYYVPLPDISTVAGHMMAFHGHVPADMNEADMIAAHHREHQQVEAGNARLHVHHWHTEKRPTEGKKGKGKP